MFSADNTFSAKTLFKGLTPLNEVLIYAFLFPQIYVWVILYFHDSSYTTT